jgi:hypothetical protein
MPAIIKRIERRPFICIKTKGLINNIITIINRYIPTIISVIFKTTNWNTINTIALVICTTTPNIRAGSNMIGTSVEPLGGFSFVIVGLLL